MTDLDDLSGLSGPSVTETYGFAWSELRRAFLELLLIGIVALVVCAPQALLGRGVLRFAYHVFVVNPIWYGSFYVYLRAARGETPEVNDLFAPFQRNYWQVVLASLLVAAIVVIGFCLLIVPGVILAVRLSFVPFLVVDEGLDALAALRESWERTRAHGWTIFGIGLLGIPIVVAGLILLVVGVIPAAMWVHLAIAVFYAAIAARERAAREAGLAPPSPAPAG